MKATGPTAFPGIQPGKARFVRQRACLPERTSGGTPISALGFDGHAPVVVYDDGRVTEMGLARPFGVAYTTPESKKANPEGLA